MFSARYFVCIVIDLKEHFNLKFIPNCRKKMLNISRNAFNLQGIKCGKYLQRAACSGRFPQLSSCGTLQNASNNESPKAGYGEKEICLLGPIDVRTPLPGNTGIPPLSLLCSDIVKELPEPSGEKCEVTRSLLPEERYLSLLTQVVYTAGEENLSSYPLECSGYECPELLKEDFKDLFPTQSLSHNPLTVIILCQKTKNNMSEWSEEAETERISVESTFITTAAHICALLKSAKYWADFIHPNTGKPNFESITSATMFETDLRYRNFGLTIEDYGCCRVMMHKNWGTNVFVGAIFTDAHLCSKEIQSVLCHYKSIDV